MQNAKQIVVAARVGFETVEEMPNRLRNVDFPIALALPWRYAMWQAVCHRRDEMMVSLEEAGLEVASVHATQGRIGDPAFLTWGRQNVEIAERLGASTMTVHPERAKTNRENLQEAARKRLKRLRNHTDVVLAVETFGDRRRIFRPEEIMDNNLPMTLDTAHLHDDSHVLGIIRAYWQHIPVVHLSSRGPGEHHLPIDTFCIRVVRELAELGWIGSIVLEYMPWHHYRLRQDVRFIEGLLAGNTSEGQLRPRSDAYRDRPDMWRHDAPWPDD